jgi:predicted choloylglycine hydrolase
MPSSLEFQSVHELAPGPKWQALFSAAWPAYEAWFLSEGDPRRPTYLESTKMLRRHMPELVPLYDQLVDLAGGGDRPARLLSLYCPAPLMSGCSQAVWSGPSPVLVRNYDYSPARCDGVLLMSRWLKHRVIASTDCSWGVLDGMNEPGLAVSLAFGGSATTGKGFGVTLVLRYILETCTRVADAITVLGRVPVNLAYNLTLLDATGQFSTVNIAPDRPMTVTTSAVATNHHGAIEWPAHAEATATVEREEYLRQRLASGQLTEERLIDAFLHPPVFSTSYAAGWGTLYTAVYRPGKHTAELRWSGTTWRQTFDTFREQTAVISYPDRE